MYNKKERKTNMTRRSTAKVTLKPQAKYFTAYGHAFILWLIKYNYKTSPYFVRWFQHVKDLETLTVVVVIFSAIIKI